MKTNWKALLKGSNMRVQGEEVTVYFDHGRKHTVWVDETSGTFEIQSVVAKAAAVQHIPNLPMRIWQVNRSAQLVGFRLDARGRICARGWVPKEGLTVEEFQQVVRRVAEEADRLEFLLTGMDLQ
ncbi:MAG: hypothetical protein IPK82_16465 [Polyangiaceae bacterium]|nr:hypothetical protein [Polyangiaceae bacterium]